MIRIWSLLLSILCCIAPAWAQAMSPAQIGDKTRTFNQLLAAYRKEVQQHAGLTAQAIQILQEAQNIITELQPYTNVTQLNNSYLDALQQGQADIITGINTAFDNVVNFFGTTDSKKSLTDIPTRTRAGSSYYQTIADKFAQETSKLLARIYTKQEKGNVLYQIDQYVESLLMPFINMFGGTTSDIIWYDQPFVDAQTVFLQELHQVLRQIYPTDVQQINKGKDNVLHLTKNSQDLINIKKATGKSLLYYLQEDLEGYKKFLYDQLESVNIKSALQNINAMISNIVFTYPQINPATNTISYDQKGEILMKKVLLPSLGENTSLAGMIKLIGGKLRDAQIAWQTYGKEVMQQRLAEQQKLFEEQREKDLSALMQEVQQLSLEADKAKQAEAFIRGLEKLYEQLPKEIRPKQFSHAGFTEWMKKGLWDWFSTAKKQEHQKKLEFIESAVIDILEYLHKKTGLTGKEEPKKQEKPTTPQQPEKPKQISQTEAFLKLLNQLVVLAPKGFANKYEITTINEEKFRTNYTQFLLSLVPFARKNSIEIKITKPSDTRKTTPLTVNERLELTGYLAGMINSLLLTISESPLGSTIDATQDVTITDKDVFSKNINNLIAFMERAPEKVGDPKPIKQPGKENSIVASKKVINALNAFIKSSKGLDHKDPHDILGIIDEAIFRDKYKSFLNAIGDFSKSENLDITIIPANNDYLAKQLTKEEAQQITSMLNNIIACFDKIHLLFENGKYIINPNKDNLINIIDLKEYLQPLMEMMKTKPATSSKQPDKPKASTTPVALSKEIVENINLLLTALTISLDPQDSTPTQQEKLISNPSLAIIRSNALINSLKQQFGNNLFSYSDLNADKLAGELTLGEIQDLANNIGATIFDMFTNMAPQGWKLTFQDNKITSASITDFALFKKSIEPFINLFK